MGPLGSGEIVILIFMLALTIGTIALVTYGVKNLSDRSRANSEKPIEDGSVRASEADRNQTVTKLQEEVGNGRLKLSEFEERVQIAQRATTLGELAQLVRDLPQDSR